MYKIIIWISGILLCSFMAVNILIPIDRTEKKDSQKKGSIDYTKYSEEESLTKETLFLGDTIPIDTSIMDTVYVIDSNQLKTHMTYGTLSVTDIEKKDGFIYLTADKVDYKIPLDKYNNIPDYRKTIKVFERNGIYKVINMRDSSDVFAKRRSTSKQEAIRDAQYAMEYYLLERIKEYEYEATIDDWRIIE